MLPGLPVEILQEIACQAPTAEKKALRSVCKDLALAMDCLIFTTVILNTLGLHSADGPGMIETLATGALLTDWSRFPTALKIDLVKHRPPKEYDPPNDRLEGLLHLALSSMPNIRTVVWAIHWGYPTWPRRAIMHFINSSQLIDEIEIRIETRVDMDCSWEQVRGIRKLTINSRYTPTILFAQLTRLVANTRSLEGLHLLAPAEWSQFWITLREQNMHLTDVATNNVTDDFLRYLGSYSGLQRLTLQYPSASTEAESNRLANHFFGSVLPQHKASLLHLSCVAWFEGCWSFGTHNADVISGLHRLSRLWMSVNGHDVQHEHTDNYSEWNAPERLLQIATELPVRHLGIFPADPEESRDTLAGDYKHTFRVSQGIITALLGFAARSSSPVRCGSWCQAQVVRAKYNH
ncbi:hypothetical protein MSAN_01899100 [Mycena sanguinolenta]|uniref:F-box domain-containing protein n=1 Tax=Mycena sanguinolenta TaxID=230812 RepID=A0A8H6XNW3_9AGAR|nr:hypothetical protein MSAN_01899100 [Mycena sanguinolenta]